MLNDKIAQAVVALTDVQQKNLIAALATRKDVNDACIELARTATKEAVGPLAALLDDEDHAHMARYAMETIPDPSVDDAFREALGKLKGKLLVGVIGSIGVRRDAKATKALIELMKSDDGLVARAAARALGNIGTLEAADAILAAVQGTAKENRLDFCEGAFRCAEYIAAQGFQLEALKIYDRLREFRQAPHQVRAGALRGAALLRKEEGIPLLMKAIRGDDFAMVSAAACIAQEMPSSALIKAIQAEMGNLSEDKQTLLKQALML